MTPPRERAPECARAFPCVVLGWPPTDWVSRCSLFPGKFLKIQKSKYKNHFWRTGTWTQFLSLVSREEHGGAGTAGTEQHRTGAGARVHAAACGVAPDEHVAIPECDFHAEHWPRNLGAGAGRTAGRGRRVCLRWIPLDLPPFASCRCSFVAVD